MGRDSKERKGLRERHDLRKRHDLREEIRLSKRKGDMGHDSFVGGGAYLGLSACSPDAGRRLDRPADGETRAARGMVQMGMERRDWRKR